MTYRIGILQTDAVVEHLQPDHGDYPEMFEKLLGRLNPTIAFTTYNVQHGLPEDVSCEAYVVTGSRCSVYDDLPWIHQLVGYLQKVLASGAKVIGVCFGHQLMAHFFGGEASRADKGWAVGVHRSTVVASQPWMIEADRKQELSLLSSHQDQVTTLPEGATLYMTNDFCPMAGFVMDDQVITIQGHPEFNKEYAAALMGIRREILGEEVYGKGIASLTQDTDADVVGRWLLAFIGASGDSEVSEAVNG